MVRVFVGVGSNIEPEFHVLHALQRLDEEVGVVDISTFYVTQALERPADPPFVNGVVEVKDAMAPEELKALLRRIEQGEGRHTNLDRFAPRPIDLDLLLYGDAVIASAGLQLPHPDVVSRRFVTLPLLELAPDLALPGSGQHLSAVARKLPPWPMTPDRQLTSDLRRAFLDEHGEG
jgi:2-amino-4-hydroxy-6-hydroxymethyldihydropteridine diphosphokinase